MSAAVKFTIMEAGKKLGEELGKKAIGEFFSENEIVLPDGNRFRIPARRFNKGRVSTNFHHKSWVSPGSPPVRVRFTVHGVDESMRSAIRVQMKGDKWGRTDRYRGPGWLHHGKEFDLEYGNDKDRGYYFAPRGDANWRALPRGAYFQIERTG